MKRIITVAILMIGASFGVSNRATAQEATLKVDVPFEFAVGNHLLPAGNYQIASHGDSLFFDNREQGAGLFTMAIAGDTTKDGQSKLTFDNVEGKYFLRKIVSTSQKTSATFPVSKLERHARETAQATVGTRNIYAETSSR
jgi:hypothetical protein